MTALVLKRRLNSRLLVGLLVLFILATVFVTAKKALAPDLAVEYEKGIIAGQDIMLEVADEPKEHVMGLSGRTKLPENYGMLFVFAEPSDACFWMKDMNFDLDILWFDENKKLIHQVQQISRDSYPKSYCSATLAKYVVELDSGNSVARGIKLGDTLTLQNH